MGLICALLKHLKINNCDVTYPKKSDGGNGKDAIGKVLKLLTEGAYNVSGILVVADADDNADNAFKEVSTHFTGKFRAPKKPFSVEKGVFRTGIFLLPGVGKVGALEHLVLDVVQNERPDILACVDTLRSCTTGATPWDHKKDAKMKMQCVIASTCEKNPYCSLAWAWDYKSIPVSISSPALKELSDFLLDFSS
jgi:hypothetical protein